MYRHLRPSLVALATLLVVVAAAPVSAQSGEKRPLTIADYQLWRTISDQEISPDGEWVAWTYNRVRTDDELHVRSVEGGTEHVVPNGSDPVFSDDNRWMAFFISEPFLEREQAERDGDDTSRKVGLMELESGEIRSWDEATRFSFADGSSHFFVEKEQAGDGDHDGTNLILRNLREGFEELIGSVSDAEFNDAGSYLAYTVDAEGGFGNGLYLLDLSSGARRALDNSTERYANMTWSEDGSSLAVLRGDVPDGKTERENSIVAFSEVGASAMPRRYDFEHGGSGLAEGSVISENGRLVWADDNRTLFVSTKAQDDELEDWSDELLPLADVNIWHWADDRIQSQQQRQAGQDRNRAYVAAVHLGDARLVQIADERMRTAEIGADGRWAIGRDDRDYVSDWQPRIADYYRVDTRTGERTTVLEGHLRTMGISPDGANWLYWKDGDVWRYDIAADRHSNLTDGAPVDFTDAEYDRFGEKPPYGLAGWTEDREAILLNHRYDVWLQPLDGSTATNLTQGHGANGEIELRIVDNVFGGEEWVDLDEPVLFMAYGEWTKKEGFFELDDGRLNELTWEDRYFTFPQKAEDADRYLFTVQTFQDFPDLWVSGRDFSDRERMTVANPQQDQFRWGTRILFDYTNDDGVPLQGTLAIPEGYEPGDKLPMVVRFYEKYSQDLHRYPTPEYRHSPNFAGLVSNGYLLMQPDVHFRIGSSHSDMLECVEAAVRKVIELGYADPESVGLSGHSYSGGGGAYIATRSDMFSAVAHGAAPINLVSEFNQLFVGSGQNNHNYDIYGQGRYATNPYDDFDLYWDQSPISGVETMDTPVLYLHGEEDPTVNWEQGLEWYNALRFLEKPVIWLSYPDEGHGLRKLQNRIDFQYRLRDFFNHHLKGMEAPSWMTSGVPYLDKDRHAREYAPRIFRRPVG